MCYLSAAQHEFKSSMTSFMNTFSAYIKYVFRLYDKECRQLTELNVEQSFNCSRKALKSTNNRNIKPARRNDDVNLKILNFNLVLTVTEHVQKV